MNDPTNRLTNYFRLLHSDDAGPPPKDELDGLLRDWHQEHADLARAQRATILAAVARDADSSRYSAGSVIGRIGRTLTSRVARAAAAIVLVATLATIVLMPTRNAAVADLINVAEGGELTAFSADGDRLGPCPLQHTDVSAEVTGPVSRVTVKQHYANPYPQKIEANYTFPLSHRSAVDSMRITVKSPDGRERVVEAEVKERELARQIYESAKRSGYVASLLEQERPNIFTQSVANIEPGASVTVEISYLEFLSRKDGVYSFDFPMVVAPRYIPGAPTLSPDQLPEGLESRAGIILLGPAEVTVTSVDATLPGSALQSMLTDARPIRTPSPQWMERPAADLGQPVDFVVTYSTGSKEQGQYFDRSGVGQLNGRWFHVNARRSGAGFAADTALVPDASRITPMPTKPTERAGHDVSMRVTIDSGGPAIRAVKSELHDITESDGPRPGSKVIELKSKSTIPNRDFILSWQTDGDAIGEGVLTHMRESGDSTSGGYFAILLDPPARPKAQDIPSRELIFVLDTSGSMSGFPIEKAKEVMSKAVAAMRPADTFNVITFAGDTHVLWPEPRIASEENRRAATDFVEGQRGGGGTEMLKAIETALRPSKQREWMKIKQLVELPADGRMVQVEAPMKDLDGATNTIALGNGKSVRVTFGVSLPSHASSDEAIRMTGRWMTQQGDRVLVVDGAMFARNDVAPNRMVFFLTDGRVGNEGGILQLVRDFAKTTRVFSFGIGNSVNRSLLDGAAREGRGAAEFVTLASSADDAVARLTRRIQSPVLVDIEASFSGVEVFDLLPTVDRIPDLYDEEPLVLLGRYTKPGQGTVTVRGRNGAGPWERTLTLDLTGKSSDKSAIATLWARAKVDQLTAPVAAAIEAGQPPADVKRAVVSLGEGYKIMTPFTSFVAVEKSRVTVGGAPMLVQIPIELPEGTSWKGFFGEGVSPAQWVADGLQDENTTRRSELIKRLRSDATLQWRESEGEAGGVRSEAETSLWFFDKEDALSAGIHRDALSDLPSDQMQLDVRRRLSIVSPASPSAPALPMLGDIPVLDNRFGIPTDGAAGSGMGGGGVSAPFVGHVHSSTTAGNPASPASAAAPSVGLPMPGKRPPTYGKRAPGPGTPDPRPAGSEAAGESPVAAPAPRSLAPEGGSKSGEERTRGTEKQIAPPPHEAKPGSIAPSASDGPQPRNETLSKKDASPPVGDAAGGTNAPGDKEKSETVKGLDAVEKDAPPTQGAVTDKQPRAMPLTPADRDRLARRVDRSLLVVALAAEIDSATALELAKTMRPAIVIDSEGLTQVTSLVKSADEKEFLSVLATLKDAGVRIDASDPSTRLVVMRLGLRDVLRIALLDAIRRVEPFRATAPQSGH